MEGKTSNIFHYVWHGFEFRQPVEQQQDGTKWCSFLFLLLAEDKQTELRIFFDLEGSNYSEVVFFPPLLLLLLFLPLLVLSPHCPFSTHQDYGIQSSPDKTTACQRIAFLWSRRQSVVFLSWPGALTPDPAWLLPWRSPSADNCKCGPLIYPLRASALSPQRGNTTTVRHLSMCVCR